MEILVTKNLWIWHTFIGILVSFDDINVVDHFPLMMNYLQGVAPHTYFTVNNP